MADIEIAKMKSNQHNDNEITMKRRIKYGIIWRKHGVWREK